MRQHLWCIFAILSLALLLYLAGTFRTGFQGTDELRYAQIAKELGPGRDWFLLHFNGVRYTDKPPLYFWCVRACYAALGGISPYALRLPGALSGAVCCVLTYFMALALFKKHSVALLAAATMIVLPRFLWITRWGRLDIMLCAFVFSAMLCFIRGYFVTPKRLGGFWFWAFLGLAFAVKGPPALIPLLGTPIIFLIWQKEAKRIGELFYWRGIAAAIGINLTWILPIIAFDLSSARGMFMHEVVARSIAPDRHVRPFWYYAGDIWYDTFPAMPLVFLALVQSWIGRNTVSESDGETANTFCRDNSSAARFCLAWFGAVFIGFSAFSSKRMQYLLPMNPALAMLTAHYMDYLARRIQSAPRSILRYYRGIAIPFLSLLPFAGILLFWHHEIFDSLIGWAGNAHPDFAERVGGAREALGEFGAFQPTRSLQIAGTLATLGLASALFIAGRKPNPIPSYALMLLGTYLGFFYFFGWMVPPAYPDADLRRFAEETSTRLRERPGLSICMYGNDKPYYNIYGDFHVAYFEGKEVRKEFLEFVRLKRPVMVILEEKAAKRMADDPPFDAMRRRETTMRGDPIVVLESP
ncbi:glycosyltransferase family 39 protein [Candidatus Sumerlaeota bacterium]|nr:glycosyltransferase family 39 protein [Candidatus Sumerlaeota bacterium]